MQARDIMTENPRVVTPDEPLTRAAEIMREIGVGIVPVVDDRSGMHLLGVLTDRDIAVRCVALGHTAGRCAVADHMTADHLESVHPESDVREVINKMERDHIRRVPVVDDTNRLAGIIAQADLAVKLGPKSPQLIEEVLEQVSAAPPQ